MARGDLPSPEIELHRYREHNNQPDNADYRAYLQRFVDSAVTPYVGGGRLDRNPPFILDFGSGPFPVLSEILRDAGHRVASYDPFFLPNEEELSAAVPLYDAVVMLEVIEHLHRPEQELHRLCSLMKPEALLILRTGVFDARDPAEDFESPEPIQAGSGSPGGRGTPSAAGPNRAAGAAEPAAFREAPPGSAAERFLAWWYRRDPTHVVFLTPATIAWLETRFSLRLIHHAKGDELVFQRKDSY